MLLKFLGKYRDLGLLMLRIGLGIMFCLHGMPRLYAGKGEWKALGSAMGVLHVHFWPVFWGFMAAATLCIGGILLILGLAYRPTCLLLTFVMIVAALTLWHDHANFRSRSHPIEMACVFFALAFVGPGNFSIDKD